MKLNKILIYLSIFFIPFVVGFSVACLILFMGVK